MFGLSPVRYIFFDLSSFGVVNSRLSSGETHFRQYREKKVWVFFSRVHIKSMIYSVFLIPIIGQHLTF
jgi:hypothetical protein